jgi:GH25 family lysozyme M1 (1,4-beta-N-acetylmuramidase)
MPLIKHPPVYDISHWIEIPDFGALDPKPWLILTKATQGTWLMDAQYAEYADGIRDADIRLGAFHYMEPGDEIAQADWFCEIILQVGLRGDEILACDMEVSGISLAEIRNFLDRVQVRTGIRPRIYSSQLRIEGLYPNSVCPQWLKDEEFGLWIAEYPDSPDLTSEIPSWIVPRGLSKRNIAMWQYTDDGIIGGIPGNNVDLNLINPDYAQAIGLAEPIPGGVPMPEQYYEVESTISTEYRSIRKTYAVTAAKIGQIDAGRKAKASIDDAYTYEADVPNAAIPGGFSARKGDRWVHAFENNGLPVDGWIAEIHLGKRFTKLATIFLPTPPPEESMVTVDVIAHDVKLAGDLYAARGVKLTKEQ